jgi:signal transduction histidine kinase/ligand-binding sensor domain-containing protein/DNA-binding response OmpR family regulator
MLRKITYLLILLPYILFAQEDTFYHYGIDEGLSQQTVQTMIKDQTGFIWIGTQEGLNRFDGSSFKVYKNDFEINNSLCGNDIKKLVEYNNYIFIGSKNNGVCYYNKTLNIFYKTDIEIGLCTGLVVHNDAIYASILNDGVYKITLNAGVFTSTKIVNSVPKNITSLYINNETLFIGTSSGIVFYAEINNLDNLQSVRITEDTETINTFYYNDSLWIGTSVGLYNYNMTSKQLAIISIENDSLNLKKVRINKIFSDKSNYYIASNNGLYLLKNYNANLHSFKQSKVFIGDKNKLNSITSNRVYDILLSDDMLWIGTNKLDVLTLNKPVFKSINTKSKTQINNNHVYAILKTNNYLFIGTRNGLNCIDKNGKATLISKENTNNKLAFNVIRGIAKDYNENLWLATTKGVSIIDLTNFNPENPKITSFYHNNFDSKSLSNNNTRSIFVDQSNHVWIATYGGGINLFTGHLKTGKIAFKHFKNAVNNTISTDFIFSINQTANNTYWICSENGLNKLTFGDDTFQNPIFKTFNENLSYKNALKSNSVLTTLLDSKDKNILWIGTENGLHKFNIDTETFSYFGSKNGLTNSVVYSILQDSKSNLWLSTNSGIFQFDKKNEHFVNYTVNDGLKNTEFNLGASFYDKKQKLLYFGGTNGVNYFSINDLDNLYHEGQLIFTSLHVKGNEINPLMDNNILSNNIITTDNIKLKYSDFPTKLEFADLNFDFPKSSDFVYKLLPHDKKWNPLENAKEIQLLNLNHGSYELLIQGKGKDKLWSKKPLKINIIVTPPWYKNTYAYALYALFLFGILFFLYNFQLKRSLERKETLRLKELNELKSKLYSNITHEFRTPLTVILGITDTIKDHLKNVPSKINTHLDMIKRNSNNLLHLVNQILDLAKSEKGQIQLNLESGDIVQHIKYLTESFSSYAEEKNISIIFYNEINKLIMDFDKDKMNKILSNLLSNAIKFSKENDKIIVVLKRDKDLLTIKVKDNGLGISKDNLPFIFDRFYQVSNDAKNGAGTGIGLALVKELVQLMSGSITVESKENKETTFSINLPINITNDSDLENFEDNQTIDKLTLLNTKKPIALVVEDNKDVATYIKLCLEQDYIILLASNGKQGIELALQHTPDIIISDVMMPLVDGFELCKAIKNDEKTNHIPIILLTAKNSQDSRIKGLTHGADAYLTKPFNKDELLIRIKKLIAIRTLLTEKYKDVSSIKLNKKLSDKNDIFVQKVISFINENIENSNYNSKNLADELNLSESQLYRKLKALSTYSTAIFIRKIRLQRAKILLETTNKTVSEICYKTGFNEPSWFSKTFKQEFGFSPSDKQN